MNQARVILKQGRDGPVRGGNPWIFSQAIARLEPQALEPGAMVEVCGSGREPIGLGYYNPATTIAVRMLAWGGARDADEVITRRLRGAFELRQRVVAADSDCYRLVNGDGDGLSGVVVDRYGEVLVVQLLTAGADRMRALIAAELGSLLNPRAIVERSQGAVRREEGLEDRIGVLWGEPPAEVVVRENGISVAVDIARGQKTGYFLDQRDNRALAGRLARDARVLDAYCYAAGFSLAALKGGAKSVVAVDTSAGALAAARRNLELNGLAGAPIELVHGEASELLDRNPGPFDLIVFDPPPLARSRKDVARARHLYVELNARAMRALAPGGRLMTFSCSTHFRGDDFVDAARMAQTRAGRSLRMQARLGPGPDHPVLLGHLEGEYLTGLLLADLG